MLTPGHCEDLHRSGLTDETIERSGIYSAHEGGTRGILGYGAGPGMVIPYPSLNVDGKSSYFRVKIDHPGPDGKRYRSPKGQPNRLYVPKLLDRAILADPSTPLWVTEGEKKALKASQEGLGCLALPGVWSWRTRQHERERSAPIPDLDQVAWRGRTVYLIFDSDLASNPSVKLAEFGLARELGRRGARVLAVRLPGGPKGEKVGLDDYLLTHSVEALCAIEPIEIHHPALRIGPEAIEVHDLLRREYAEPPALVGGGILPRQALGFIGGPPKVGKSSLALNLALRRTLGLPWLGFETTPGRVLVLQAEIPERELQGRLRLMLQDLGGDPPARRLFLATYRGLKLDRMEGLKACRRLVEALHPDLLILDPLARFYSGDENSAREVGRLVGALDELIQSLGLAVMVVHHTAKPSMTDPREGGLRLRGSSALFAAADSVLVLDKTEGGLFKLGFELRHGKEPEPMLLQRTDRLWFIPAGPPEDLLAVAALIQETGLRYRQLVQAIQASEGVSKATAERLLKRAKEAGLLALIDGEYHGALTPSRRPHAAGEESALSGGESLATLTRPQAHHDVEANQR